MMKTLAVSLLALLASGEYVTAFTPYSNVPSFASRTSPEASPSALGLFGTKEAVQVKKQFGKVVKTKKLKDMVFDGGDILLKVNTIAREDGSEFKVNIILPSEDKKAKGVAFFMHGFSQYPKAYCKTLKKIADESQIVIVAVETGVISSAVLKEVLKREDNPQFILQKAVATDTMQCIQMVQNRQEPFAEHIPNTKVPLGLIGHSMGGGLCFHVASKFPSIDYVFCMAPAPGEPAFAPHAAIEEHAPRNSMLLAGKWDLIAKGKVVKELSALCNSKKSRSSIYVDIDRGLHTGFEDDLVIFNIDLAALNSVFGIFESVIVKAFFFFRTRTGQLEITRTLLSYFCSQMVKGERLTVEQAISILETDPDMKERWVDKSVVTYGSSE
jgi:hypothetical protein